MGKKKRKLTAAEKAAKRRRRQEYMTIFINGKQKRVRRPAMIDGIPAEEFALMNADPIWLHQNEMWEYMDVDKDCGQDPSPAEEFSMADDLPEPASGPQDSPGRPEPRPGEEDDDIPF